MKLLNNIIAKNVLLFFVFSATSSFAKCMPLESFKAINDTPKASINALQSFIDARTNEINSYNSLLYRKDKLDDTIKSYRSKVYELAKDTIKEQKYSLAEVCSRLNQKNESFIYDSLKNNFKKIINAENEITSLNKAIKDSAIFLGNLDYEINSKQLKYQKTILEIITKTDTVTGFEAITFNKKKYKLFYVNNKKNEVRILPSPDKGAATIKSTLDNSNETPLMITNAGMYQPNFKPQGLLISKYEQKSEIDSTREKREGNFYLYPNGIFYIDSADKFHIATTEDYLKNHYPPKFIKYATQSGPLLLKENNWLNPNIKENSSNYNIRSGVGLISPDRAVFIISADVVSFYDFKMLFTALGCKSALYLDGFVSRMYINDKYPQRSSVNAVDDYNFGPMISVFKKK